MVSFTTIGRHDAIGADRRLAKNALALFIHAKAPVERKASFNFSCGLDIAAALHLSWNTFIRLVMPVDVAKRSRHELTKCPIRLHLIE